MSGSGSKAARKAGGGKTSAPTGQGIRTPAEALEQGLVIRRGLTVALLSIMSGLAWQLCFAPLNAWPIAFVVLVPWGLAVVGARRDRQAFLWGWLTGVLAFGIGAYWLTWITPVGYIALLLYLSLYWLLAAWAARRAFQQRVPMWIALPVIWVALEYARAFVISGFPWFYLAHSQYRCPWLIQIADVTGQWGVSVFVAMVNGLLIDLASQPLIVRIGQRLRRVAGKVPTDLEGTPNPAARLNRALPAGLATVILSLAGMLGYGAYRLSQQTTAPGPRIGVVQCAFPISLEGMTASKEGDKDDENEVFNKHLDLTRTFIGQPLDVVVWPETMLPTRFDEQWDPKEYAKPEAVQFASDMQNMQRQVSEVLTQLHAPLLAGVPTMVYDPTRPKSQQWETFNSTAVFWPGSAPGSLKVSRKLYHKMHLVPFGEYVPFRTGWPWLHDTLQQFVPQAMQQLRPGETVERFTIGQGGSHWTVATPICYEGAFDRVCRPLVYDHGQKKADVLINMSNDGWFISPGGHASSELDQHLSFYVFRAIENRVPVARAVNTGISGFVDSNGRIVQELAVGGRTKMVVGAASRQVLVDSRSSLYSLLGDWVAQLCAVAAVVLVAVVWRRGRTQNKKGVRD